MGTLIKKSKGKKRKPYWYYVESGRVDGEPRIVRQVYLGTAEKIVTQMENATRPRPLKATTLSWGLPGALWLAAQDSGMWDCLRAVWPAPTRGPGTAHYLLLAALHRVCAPGPKTTVAEWYAHSAMADQWGMAPSRFTSQAFWDAFDRIDQRSPFPDDQISQAQLRLLRRWRSEGLVGKTVLAYDSTNFYTYIDSKNDRCSLARRGKNKQKRDNLRQVGLAYAVDGTSGMGLYHHVYPGNLPDGPEFSVSLPRLLSFLDRAGVRRSTVTLTFDKGPADLANVMQLEEEDLGWIAAVPWNEIPEPLRQVDEGQMRSCSARLPGTRLYGTEVELWGGKRQAVLVHSSVFQSEQLHSLTLAIAKACGQLKALSRELAQPPARPWKETAIRTKVARILSGQWLGDVIVIDELRPTPGGCWALQFHVDNHAILQLLRTRLGRTLIATNRLKWPFEDTVAAYYGQSGIEREFRAMKDGEGCHWGPMFHWTDSKIRVHAFTIVLGLSLINYLNLRLHKADFPMSREQMLTALKGIEDVVVVYPRTAEKGRYPTARVTTHDTLEQRRLGEILQFERLRVPPQG